MVTRHFPDTESMLAALKPGYPVYCLRPAVLRARARWFVDHFPGTVLYAVKCNPHPLVLKHLHAGGIRHYDTASLPEIAQVGELFADATLYFMHPVKGRAAIRSADRVYGVRHYIVDHDDELDKVLAETTHDGLVIFVRLATPPAGAIFDLSAKFGARAAEAVELLKRIHEAGHRTGLAFHVGSQCVLPEAYRTALDLVASVLDGADVALGYLDVGGGFPAAYLGVDPPPIEAFLDEIRSGLAQLDLPPDCVIMCEPGRAMVADGCSLVVQVQLRKDDRLYVNDGIYGSLNEAVTARLRPPARLVRLNGSPADGMIDFTINGPTCDSADVLPFAMRLPEDAREGDWIEIGRMGAYSNATATHFNGFHPETYVEVEKEFIAS